MTASCVSHYPNDGHRQDATCFRFTLVMFSAGCHLHVRNTTIGDTKYLVWRERESVEMLCEDSFKHAYFTDKSTRKTVNEVHTLY